MKLEDIELLHALQLEDGMTILAQSCGVYKNYVVVPTQDIVDYSRSNNIDFKSSAIYLYEKREKDESTIEIKEDRILVKHTLLNRFEDGTRHKD